MSRGPVWVDRSPHFAVMEVVQGLVQRLATAITNTFCDTPQKGPPGLGDVLGVLHKWTAAYEYTEAQFGSHALVATAILYIRRGPSQSPSEMRTLSLLQKSSVATELPSYSPLTANLPTHHGVPRQKAVY